MNKNGTKWKWLTAVAVLTIVLAGCADANEEGAGNAEQPPVQETPAEQEPQPAEEAPTEETPGEAASEPLGVETGASKEIDTEIEGMAHQVNVTEYTLTPYGIRYELRTDMGEPTVENGQVVYTTQMGDDVAKITLEVKTDATLEEAAAEAQQAFADGYEANPLEDIGTDLNSYAGKVQGFQKDGYFFGFHVFDVDGSIVVIHHSYPAEAGDGMGPVTYELLKSLKG